MRESSTVGPRPAPAPGPEPWSRTRVARVTAALARGDEAAFDELYAEYEGRLYRYLLVAARGDEEVVREVLQECWIRAVRHARPFEVEAVLWSWLSRLARTALIDHHRRQRRHRQGVPLDDGELPSSEPPDERADGALLRIVEAVVAALPAAERRLIDLRYRDQRDLRAIARELGTSRKAVESKLGRVRGKLRRRLLRRLGDV